MFFLANLSYILSNILYRIFSIRQICGLNWPKKHVEKPGLEKNSLGFSTFFFSQYELHFVQDILKDISYLYVG